MTNPEPPRLHDLADRATTGLILCSVVFAPWALAGTRPWSLWTLNAIGFSLGVVLLGKWIIRWQTGFRPARWNRPAAAGTGLTWLLALLSVAIVAWTFLSAANARSQYDADTNSLRSLGPYFAWLPHSYDAPSTWRAAWTYLGLAGTFWALFDWLSAKSASELVTARLAGVQRMLLEERGILSSPAEADRQTGTAARLPDRLRWLLWTLCVNGAVLSVVAIVQRYSGAPKLLWVFEDPLRASAEGFFGPFYYRNNGGQYLNVIWPVSVGLWALLRAFARSAYAAGERPPGAARHLLIPCTAAMLAGPFVSTSRGSAITAVILVLGVIAVATLALSKGRRWRVLLAEFLVLAVALTAGLAMNWKKLGPRLEEMLQDESLGGRTPIYAAAKRLAEEHPPLFGCGPGTFPNLNLATRQGSRVAVDLFVHDDWLETRVTFGWIGFGMVLAALASVPARWLAGGGIPMAGVLPAMIGLALAGCLFNARFDFVVQTFALLQAVIVLCCLGFSLSRLR